MRRASFRAASWNGRRDHGLEYETDVRPRSRLRGTGTARRHPGHPSEGRNRRRRARLGRGAVARQGREGGARTQEDGVTWGWVLGAPR